MSEELNIDEQLEQVDMQIAEQEYHIKRAEALARLKENPDFQLVMIEGYLQLEADRVFNLLVHPLTVKPDDRDSYLSQLDTIKNVSRYLGTDQYKGTVNILAINAKKAIDELIAIKQDLIANKGE